MGQTLRVEVFPERIGPNGYLEFRISTSWQPAVSGRPAGLYQLCYRLGGPAVPGSSVATGLEGVVTLPAVLGQWNSVAVTPTDDLKRLWPDLDARDFTTAQLRLGAVSQRRAPTTGYFDYLRFDRIASGGQIPLNTQRSIMTAYASQFLQQHQGLEISWVKAAHLNWFGGAVALPDYTGVARSDIGHLRTLVDTIHGAGGLASYNHPFGTADGTPGTPASQEQLVKSVATSMLANKAYGADLLEVGYQARGHIDLRHFVSLWDICSRNALFLTGNGTSDDHSGNDWTGRLNNFLTFGWAPSTAENDLLTAMRSGRLYAGTIDGFRGTLDLLVDGSCPMGSVSVSQLPKRNVQVIGTGIPDGGSVRLAQGFVDYAGPSNPSGNTVTIATLAGSDLAAGSAVVAIDNSVSSFVRTEVQDAAGNVVGLSNPAWLLRESPPGGVPTSRGC